VRPASHIPSAFRAQRVPFLKLGIGARCALCTVIMCSVGLQVSWAQQQPPTSPTAGGSSPHLMLSPPPDVASPSPSALKTASGIFMKVLASGYGSEHPVENDCVRVRFTAWKRDGSLFSTSGIHGESIVQCINNLIPGAAEALGMMVTGEKRRVWVPASLTFGRKHHHRSDRMALDEEPPPNTDLTFDVELLEVMKAPPTPADLKTPPEDAVKTASGVAFRVLKSGAGAAHPSMTSQVTLHFSGWTSDGNLFESTMISGHPAIFQVGSTPPGWREALQHMVVGEKVRLWIPASLAYGEKPVNHMNPAGNLVYDIELLASQ